MCSANHIKSSSKCDKMETWPVRTDGNANKKLWAQTRWTQLPMLLCLGLETCQSAHRPARNSRLFRHQQRWQRSDGVVDNLKHISKRVSYNKMYKYVHIICTSIIIYDMYVCVCTAYVYSWLISTHLFLCRTASIISIIDFLWALSPLEWLYHLYLEVKIQVTDCSIRL